MNRLLTILAAAGAAYQATAYSVRTSGDPDEILVVVVKRWVNRETGSVHWSVMIQAEISVSVRPSPWPMIYPAVTYA